MLEWYLKYLNEKLFINCRRFSVFLSYLSEIMRGFPIYSLVYKHWEFNSKFSPENIIVALITVFNISFLVNGFMIHTSWGPKTVQNSYDQRCTSALFFLCSSFAKPGAVWRLVCVLERHQISEISLCRDFAQYATSQMTPSRIISHKSINFYLL